MHKDVFEPLTAEEENIGRRIVHAAYEVHKALGPGLMEKVYEVCFCHVLRKSGYTLNQQEKVRIIFERIIL
jgi:GxxExxY protein